MVKKKEVQSRETLGFVGLNLGILSLIFLITVNPITSIVTSLVGVIFSLIQQHKNPTKIGKVGLIVNIVAIIITIIFMLVVIFWLGPLIDHYLAS